MELYQTKSQFSWYYLFPDYLQISVEVPNTSLKKKLGNVFAVHKFNTSFTPEPQIMDFVQMGAQSGEITMRLIRRRNLVTVYNLSKTIPYNCSEEDFIKTIKSFSGYSEYPLDGERFVYDQYDTLLDGSNNYTDAYKYVWRIKIYKVRI